MKNQIIKFTATDITEKHKTRIKRYPNLNTVLMVEDVLKKYCDVPMKLSEIKKKLPKQVMHQTLILILEYLWRSGKIIYGPKGIQWIYTTPEHLTKLLKGGL